MRADWPWQTGQIEWAWAQGTYMLFDAALVKGCSDYRCCARPPDCMHTTNCPCHS